MLAVEWEKATHFPTPFQVLRTILLILQCIIIACLPVVALFTYKYKEIKVSSEGFLRVLRVVLHARRRFVSSAGAINFVDVEE